MTEDGVAIEVGFRLNGPVTVQRVGRRLAFMRDVRGVTPQRMAIVLRVTDAQYARFEDGQESMTLAQLIRAAAELDVAVCELVK